MTREKIISALKRNDRVEIAGIIALNMGADADRVGEVTDTTRATDKFYQTLFDLVDFDTEDNEVEDTVETPEEDEDE